VLRIFFSLSFAKFVTPVFPPFFSTPLLLFLHDPPGLFPRTSATPLPTEVHSLVFFPLLQTLTQALPSRPLPFFPCFPTEKPPSLSTPCPPFIQWFFFFFFPFFCVWCSPFATPATANRPSSPPILTFLLRFFTRFVSYFSRLFPSLEVRSFIYQCVRFFFSTYLSPFSPEKIFVNSSNSFFKPLFLSSLCFV